MLRYLHSRGLHGLSLIRLKSSSCSASSKTRRAGQSTASLVVCTLGNLRMRQLELVPLLLVAAPTPPPA
ncbi:hypothetical protein E2C01_038916 [Portunus trituberculatus]|uniref:Uncharacterized protein n=1 Tax=Portunus trituberculatus TaxID=210409 RepID=A0A5B7FLC2_PORTR|nr:hypothetical protein [Portunus trituberculatus]